MCIWDVCGDICCICVDLLDCFVLFGNYCCELGKDVVEFGNGRFDGFDGGGVGLYVCVL